jgi:hypothetical protein
LVPLVLEAFENLSEDDDAIADRLELGEAAVISLDLSFSMDDEDDAASSVLQNVVVDPFISRELQEDFKSTAFLLLWRAFKQGGGEREHA